MTITEKEKKALEELLEKHGNKRTKHFNGLNEAEHERLSILMEECGEVVQIVGKILRHGYESYNPYDKDKVTNRELLMKELGDVENAKNMLTLSNDLQDYKINLFAEDKYVNIKKYLHHQKR